VFKTSRFQETPEGAIERCRSEIHEQTLAAYLAGEFAKAARGVVSDFPTHFSFLTASICCIGASGWSTAPLSLPRVWSSSITLILVPPKIYNMEPLITGEYTKYSNNAGWVADNLPDAINAFGHWSY